MPASLPLLAPLHNSLQRFRGRLEVAMQDSWATSALEEVIRHVEPVLVDLGKWGGPTESTRAHLSALGAQLQASERANVFAWDDELEREAKVLMPLLAVYLESLRIGGAA